MIRSLYEVIRNFSIKTRDDYISAFSAQAAFFIFISFFPFIILLLTLLQYLPITEANLVGTITQYLPTSIKELIVDIIGELYTKTSTTFLSVTAITALWSAARGFLAIIRGVNGVYRIKETRNYFLMRFLASIYTLVFIVLILISFAILVFGNKIYLYIQARVPLLSDLALLIISLRTIVGFCILVVFFLLLYMIFPNRKTRIIQELPGAIVSAAGWMLFSYAYSFYIDNMSNFSYMYGSLAAIVLCMLWVYFCMYILFIGAEINVVLKNKEMLHDLQNLKKEFNNTKNLKVDIEAVKKTLSNNKHTKDK